MKELRVESVPNIMFEGPEGRDRLARMERRARERRAELEEILTPEALARLDAAEAEIEDKFLFGEGE